MKWHILSFYFSSLLLLTRSCLASDLQNVLSISEIKTLVTEASIEGLISLGQLPFVNRTFYSWFLFSQVLKRIDSVRLARKYIYCSCRINRLSNRSFDETLETIPDNREKALYCLALIRPICPNMYCIKNQVLLLRAIEYDVDQAVLSRWAEDVAVYWIEDVKLRNCAK